MYGAFPNNSFQGSKNLQSHKKLFLPPANDDIIKSEVYHVFIKVGHRDEGSFKRDHVSVLKATPEQPLKVKYSRLFRSGL